MAKLYLDPETGEEVTANEFRRRRARRQAASEGQPIADFMSPTRQLLGIPEPGTMFSTEEQKDVPEGHLSGYRKRKTYLDPATGEEVDEIEFRARKAKREREKEELDKNAAERKRAEEIAAKDREIAERVTQGIPFEPLRKLAASKPARLAMETATGLPRTIGLDFLLGPAESDVQLLGAGERAATRAGRKRGRAMMPTVGGGGVPGVPDIPTGLEADEDRYVTDLPTGVKELGDRTWASDLTQETIDKIKAIQLPGRNPFTDEPLAEGEQPYASVGGSVGVSPRVAEALRDPFIYNNEVEFSRTARWRSGIEEAIRPAMFGAGESFETAKDVALPAAVAYGAVRRPWHTIPAIAGIELMSILGEKGARAASQHLGEDEERMAQIGREIPMAPAGLKVGPALTKAGLRATSPLLGKAKTRKWLARGARTNNSRERSIDLEVQRVTGKTLLQTLRDVGRGAKWWTQERTTDGPFMAMRRELGARKDLAKGFQTPYARRGITQETAEKLRDLQDPRWRDKADWSQPVGERGDFLGWRANKQGKLEPVYAPASPVRTDAPPGPGRGVIYDQEGNVKDTYDLDAQGKPVGASGGVDVPEAVRRYAPMTAGYIAQGMTFSKWPLPLGRFAAGRFANLGARRLVSRMLEGVRRKKPARNVEAFDAEANEFVMVPEDALINNPAKYKTKGQGARILKERDALRKAREKEADQARKAKEKADAEAKKEQEKLQKAVEDAIKQAEAEQQSRQGMSSTLSPQEGSKIMEIMEHQVAVERVMKEMGVDRVEAERILKQRGDVTAPETPIESAKFKSGDITEADILKAAQDGATPEQLRAMREKLAQKGEPTKPAEPPKPEPPAEPVAEPAPTKPKAPEGEGGAETVESLGGTGHLSKGQLGAFRQRVEMGEDPVTVLKQINEYRRKKGQSVPESKPTEPAKAPPAEPPADTSLDRTSGTIRTRRKKQERDRNLGEDAPEDAAVFEPIVKGQEVGDGVRIGDTYVDVSGETPRTVRVEGQLDTRGKIRLHLVDAKTGDWVLGEPTNGHSFLKGLRKDIKDGLIEKPAERPTKPTAPKGGKSGKAQEPFDTTTPEGRAKAFAREGGPTDAEWNQMGGNIAKRAWLESQGKTGEPRMTGPTPEGLEGPAGKALSETQTPPTEKPSKGKGKKKKGKPRPGVIRKGDVVEFADGTRGIVKGKGRSGGLKVQVGETTRLATPDQVKKVEAKAPTPEERQAALDKVKELGEGNRGMLEREFYESGPEAAVILGTEKMGLEEPVVRSFIESLPETRPPATPAEAAVEITKGSFKGQKGVPIGEADAKGVTNVMLESGEVQPFKAGEFKVLRGSGKDADIAATIKKAEEDAGIEWGEPLKGPEKAPEAPGAPVEGKKAPEAGKPATGRRGAWSGLDAAVREGDQARASSIARGAVKDPEASAVVGGQGVRVGDVIESGPHAGKMVLEVQDGAVVQMTKKKFTGGGGRYQVGRVTTVGELTARRARPNYQGYYSQLERVLETPHVQETQVAHDWLRFLKKRKRGVTADELYWTGLEEFLKSKKPWERVTKGKLLQYLKDNKVELSEWRQGDIHQIDFNSPAQVDAYVRMWERRARESGVYTEQEVRNIGAAMRNDPMSRIDQLREDITKPEYGDYKEPGGTNYREFIVTIPSKSVPTPLRYRVESMDRSIPPEKKARVDELNEEKGALEAALVTEFGAVFRVRRGEPRVKPRHLKDKDRILEINKEIQKIREEGGELWTVESYWADNGVQAKSPGTGGTYKSQAEAKAAAEKLAKEKPTHGRLHAKWDAPHFSHLNAQGGILYHIRMTDRIDPATGEKILFAEEFQSDAAWDAKKKGVRKPNKAWQKDLERFNELSDRNREIRNKRDTSSLTKDEKRALKAEYERNSEEMQRINNKYGEHPGSGVRGFMGRKDVPTEMPYIESTNKWLDLATKRFIKMAVEEGYDQVRFTSGSMQTRRYDLSQRVDEVRWDPAEKRLEGYKDGENILNEYDVPAEKLADYIGEEPAARLRRAAQNWKEPDPLGGWGIEQARRPGEFYVIDPNGQYVYTREGKRDLFYGKDEARNYIEESIRESGDTVSQIPAISGQDLSMGSTGLAKLYDVMIPQSFNRVLKPFRTQGETIYRLEGDRLTKTVEGAKGPKLEEGQMGENSYTKRYEVREHPDQALANQGAMAIYDLGTETWARSTDPRMPIDPDLMAMRKRQGVTDTTGARANYFKSAADARRVASEMNLDYAHDRMADGVLSRFKYNVVDAKTGKIVRTVNEPWQTVDAVRELEGKSGREYVVEPAGETVHTIRIPDELKRQVEKEGFPQYKIGKEDLVETPITTEDVRMALPEALRPLLKRATRTETRPAGKGKGEVRADAKMGLRAGDWYIDTPHGGRIIIKQNGFIRIENPEQSLVGYSPEVIADVKAGKRGALGRMETPGQGPLVPKYRRKYGIDRDMQMRILNAGVIPHEMGHIFIDYFASPREKARIESWFREEMEAKGLEKYDELFAEGFREWFESYRWKKKPRNAVERVYKAIYEFVANVYDTFRPTIEGQYRKVAQGKPFKRGRHQDGWVGRTAKEAYQIAAREVGDSEANFMKWFKKSVANTQWDQMSKGQMGGLKLGKHPEGYPHYGHDKMPLELYHATIAKADFDAFKPGSRPRYVDPANPDADYGRGVDGMGIWFAEDAEFANSKLRFDWMAEDMRRGGPPPDHNAIRNPEGPIPEGGRIIPAYLSLQKPLFVRERRDLDYEVAKKWAQIEAKDPAKSAKAKKRSKKANKALLKVDRDVRNYVNELADKYAVPKGGGITFQDRLLIAYDRINAVERAKLMEYRRAGEKARLEAAIAEAEMTGNPEAYLQTLRRGDPKDIARAKKALQSEGYDGFLVGDDMGFGRAWVVFEGEQIKSSRANVGTYDPKNPEYRHMIEPERAKKLKTRKHLPTRREFAEAVQNTKGAAITEDGLIMELQRWQKPDQAGALSIRTGVFYLPKGDRKASAYRITPNSKHTGAGIAYGGTDKVEGQTLIRKPLFVRGATGGRAPEEAFKIIKGAPAFSKLEDQLWSIHMSDYSMREWPDMIHAKARAEKAAKAYSEARAEHGQDFTKYEDIYNEYHDAQRLLATTRDKIQTSEIERVLQDFGGDPSMARDILANSREGNQLRYAIQENIIAHVVRDEGFDAVVGFTKGKNGAKFSEVFDVRETTYPDTGYVQSDIHPSFIPESAGRYQVGPKKGDTSTPEFKKWFRKSTIKDGNKPRPVYHGTGKEGFFEFEWPEHDLGFHVGSRAQAVEAGVTNRISRLSEEMRALRAEALPYAQAGKEVPKEIKDKIAKNEKEAKTSGRIPGQEGFEEPRMIELYARAENPLRLHDVGDKWGYYAYDYLPIGKTVQGGKPGFTREEVQMLRDLPRRFRPAETVKLIKSKGYDSIVYKNEHEGRVYDRATGELKSRDDSYILFDKNQVKQTSNVTWGEGGDFRYQVGPKGAGSNLKRSLEKLESTRKARKPIKGVMDRKADLSPRLVKKMDRKATPRFSVGEVSDVLPEALRGMPEIYRDQLTDALTSKRFEVKMTEDAESSWKGTIYQYRLSPARPKHARAEPPRWEGEEPDAWYDPEIAELKSTSEGGFRQIGYDLKPGWTRSVEDLTSGDGTTYFRGMSAEEWVEIQRTGKIRSQGAYNLGDKQVGKTYYSVSPGQAESYAAGFQPWQRTPAHGKNAYIVEIRNPKRKGTLEQGDERGVPGEINASEIVNVYEGVPYYFKDGKVEYTPDTVRGPGGEGWVSTHVEGSRYSPSTHVAWRKIDGEKVARLRAEAETVTLTDGAMAVEPAARYALSEAGRKRLREKQMEEARKIAGEGALVDEATMEKYFRDEASIAREVHDDFSRLGYKESFADHLRAIKTNADEYYMRSLDFTTMCRKRYVLGATIDAIQQKLGRPLDAKDIMRVGAQMRLHGIETACGPCYVESKRLQNAAIMEQLKTGWYRPMPKIDPKTGKKMRDDNGKIIKVKTWIPPIPKKLHDKLLTSDGIAEIAANYPQERIKMGYLYGDRKVKAPEVRVSYKGEILSKVDKEGGLTDGMVAKMNKRSGLRWQSWSDFEVPHIIDAMQAIADMHLRGLKGHAYTKVPEFVEVLAPTGLAINMSMIPKDIGIRNGKLWFNDAESFPFDFGLRMRKKYKNVGFETIGVNDAQIKMALADPRIDYVIPYHQSGLNRNYMKMVGMGKWQDYTGEQNFTVRGTTKQLSTGKWQGKASSKKVLWDEYKGDLNLLDKLAKERGIDPPFVRMRHWKGYEKLLNDRRSFIENGKGYINQDVVKPEFDMRAIKRIMREYTPPDIKPAGVVVDEFVKGEIPAEPRQRYSLGLPKKTEGVTRGGRTVTPRNKPSQPARRIMEHMAPNLTGKTILDYGAGYGVDLKHYEGSGIFKGVQGYDPNHMQTKPRKADIVTNTFVANVLEPVDRHAMLRSAYKHANEALIVSVRADKIPGTPHLDGVITKKDTFQKSYKKGELVKELGELFGKENVEELRYGVSGAQMAIVTKPKGKLKGEDQPRFSITDPVLVAGGSAGRTSIPTAKVTEPAFTIKATPKEPIRFTRGDKVYRLSERGVARLMGVSDSYKLPENKALARTVLGNGVPPPLARAVVLPLLKGIKKPTAVTLFSGGSLVEEGLKDKVRFLGGHEISADIAGVARSNGHNTRIVDVTKADFSDFAGADWLHASPVCKNFSAAKNQSGEVPLDIRSAEAVVRAIDQVGPTVVTIENVKGYRGSEALQLIIEKLKKEGYNVDAAVYDAADYGTPQHRQRLLVRAIKGKLLPPPPMKQSHVSWWDAVKDLKHPLDPKGLADWQKRRLAPLEHMIVGVGDAP